MNMIEKIREESRLARENFISRRSLKEEQINKFRESLSELSEESKAQLGGIDLSKLDARIMFPSLYKETFSAEDYNKERLAYRDYIMPFIQLRKKLEDEAMVKLGLNR